MHLHILYGCKTWILDWLLIHVGNTKQTNYSIWALCIDRWSSWLDCKFAELSHPTLKRSFFSFSPSFLFPAHRHVEFNSLEWYPSLVVFFALPALSYGWENTGDTFFLITLHPPRSFPKRSNHVVTPSRASQFHQSNSPSPPRTWQWNHYSLIPEHVSWDSGSEQW